jgi:glycosyltransferase involved in cell wall biosynthesis
MTRVSMLHPIGLAATIRRIAPDVVHSHSGVWYKVSLAARRAGVKTLVHTEHGRRSPDRWSDRILDGVAARRTDIVVAVSERLARELPRALRIPATKVVCIPNGIDTELYQPLADTGALRRELGLSASTCIIGSIGRLETIKAYDQMVEAFANFADRPSGRDAVLVVAGEGATRGALTQQIRRLELSDRVHLLGWRSDTRDLLSAFSLFSMSSRSEGTSISLLEAMSMGIPPVVTDVGGNAAVLGPSLAGNLVPFGEPKAMADAWERVLASRAAGDDDLPAVRTRVTSAFGLEAVASAYEDVYLGYAGADARAGEASQLARAAK